MTCKIQNAGAGCLGTCPMLTVIGLLGLLLFFPAQSQCADIVYVYTQQDQICCVSNLGLAAGFYGANVKALPISQGDSQTQIEKALSDVETYAVVIAAPALSLLDRKGIYRALNRAGERRIPVLILGVSAGTTASALLNWSGGVVSACHGPVEVQAGDDYRVGSSKDVAKQLADQVLPLGNERLYWLDLTGSKNGKDLVRVCTKGRCYTVFAQTTAGNEELFFLTSSEQIHTEPVKTGDLLKTFRPIAAVMMFVRYSLAEKGWHPVGNYANLTVDDAWLVEPYGNLSFKALLKEMENHRFHTTIAFIPWNFDRSRPDVVRLFRDNSDKFSIAIHGNNHDHKEFGPFDKRPFDEQLANIKQAVARMEGFSRATGIPYDRVMAFPHEQMAPGETLALLKQYNFLGAVGAVNVPMGSPWPNDPLFALQPASLRFADFPAIRRYSLEVKDPRFKAEVAVRAFLGIPLLFYCHQSFFEKGIDSFNEVADLVNRIEPETIWQGLGFIIKHLYLARQRGANEYDVMSFSSKISLDCVAGRDAVYYVRKIENGRPGIRTITVDGSPIPYELSEGDVSFEVGMLPGQRRVAEIEYDNDLQISEIDTSKRSAYINLLRELSDFRDLRLSRSLFGEALTRLYYATNEQEVGIFLVLVALCGAAWLSVSKAKKEIGPPGLKRSSHFTDDRIEMVPPEPKHDRSE